MKVPRLHTYRKYCRYWGYHIGRAWWFAGLWLMQKPIPDSNSSDNGLSLPGVSPSSLLTTITFQRNSLVQHSSPTSGMPEPHADWSFLILWGHLNCLSRIFSYICSLTGQNVTPDSQSWGILLRSRLVNMVICMVQLFRIDFLKVHILYNVVCILKLKGGGKRSVPVKEIRYN